jgi:hypothetical protein
MSKYVGFFSAKKAGIFSMAMKLELYWAGGSFRTSLTSMV